jgi:DNA-binding PadR family transcriptional regulator
MAGRRRVSNPLALAVLGTLRERPMHPYEMASTMRSYGKERSIKLNFGSLYTVVDNLAKHGLIEAIGARREGRRPERTIYRLTDVGRAELEEWLSELIATPVKEYPQFEAALSFMPVLSPDRVLTLLRERVAVLEKTIAQTQADVRAYDWLPRLFMVEEEYALAMRQAELAWVRGLVKEFEDGSFPAIDGWRHWHETGEPPAEFLVAAAHEAAEGAQTGPGKEGEDEEDMTY